MEPSVWLPALLGIAVILPLFSFTTIVLIGPVMGRVAGYWATLFIAGSFVLSMVSFGIWTSHHYPEGEHHGDAHHAAPAGEQHDEKSHHDRGHEHHDHVRGNDAHEHGDEVHHDADDHDPETAVAYSGYWYRLGQFGSLHLDVGYYIDSLTVCMFCMVTLIATCIHIYSIGYMHEELADVTDHEVTRSDGSHLHRPGRFPRFFQFMSLFSFSMLGLVVSGNLVMTFAFWELVGICSYFLIGFYIERKSASTAANKAFIVNRVGDFGMIVGLMALWTSLGTFNFGDMTLHQADGAVVSEAGIFSLVRPADQQHRLIVPQEMAQAAERSGMDGYWLLIVAGVGIFCGCVGKSAQFPLHTWLPDAMEGPTPVSALVHSATMVAAGVFLVGRFYPVFVPEVLLVIAIVGCVTLFIAATIAIAATDIEYS